MVVLLHLEGTREAQTRGDFNVVIGQVVAVAASTVGLDEERLGKVIGADLFQHIVFDALGVAEVFLGEAFGALEA